MARSIAKIGDEKDLTALVRALYRFDDGEDPVLLRRAARALLAANPQLRTKRGFRAGVLVLVPTIEGFTFGDRVETRQEGLDEVVTEAALRLKELAARIDERTRGSKRRRERALKLAAKAKLRDTAKMRLPSSLPLIEKSTANLREEAEAVEARGKALQDAVAVALDQVERIASRGRGPGPSKDCQ